MDLSFLTRLDCCLLFCIAGIAGISYGAKKKNRLVVFAAAAISIVSGLMILAAIILINSID